MGGSNPYISQEAPKPASQKFKITFLPMNVTVEVDPEKIPYGDTGLHGSILDIALAHGIDIDHSCGGVCACSTCHCIVREGGDTLSEMSDAEDNQLLQAPGLTTKSRLSCQSVPDGSCNLIVEIPSWNRNMVREGH
jgi:ferredoxin, 2Fe-2S